MSVTFNQPIRVYKYNNPTNNGVIAPDNSGAVAATQQVQFFATPSAGAITTYGIGNQSTTVDSVVLPAGAIVTNIKFFETSAPSAVTGGVITVSIGSTTVGTITPTTANGIVAFAPAATSAAITALANVGTSDVTVTFTMGTISGVTGTLAGTFSVDYTARNFDGSITNVGQGYTNT
jgi:hypothetical protein